MTYKELKDKLFDEVGKIDLSKLSMGYGGLKDYAELLKILAKLPEEPMGDSYGKALSNIAMCNGFGGLPTPRVEEGGK